MSVGFIRLRRSAIVEQLVLDQKAWSLLGIIAARARFHDGANLHNLAVGEALVGDYERAGLTRKEYRGALHRLECKWLQITTRRTNRGTVAKFTDSAIFDFSVTSRDTGGTRGGPRKGPSEQPSDFIGENGQVQPSKGPSKRPSQGH